MPEFNRVFNEGKMNRDLDERLVPQGQYREGVNIEVTSSKNGNVGSVKNRKGNSPLALSGLTLPGNELYGLSPEAECIDYVIAEETQKTYYFVKNAKFDDGTGDTRVDSDIIAEYDANSGASRTIFVDVRKIRISSASTIAGFSLATDPATGFKIPNVLVFEYNGAFGIADFPIQTFRIGMTLPNGNYLREVNVGGGIYSLVFSTDFSTDDIIDLNSTGLILQKKSVLGIDRAGKYIASNYVDGLLFFTNGVDEPKKINVEESFNGTSQSQSLNKHTALITTLDVGTNLTVEEEHVTVIKKNPDGVLNVTLDVQIGNQQGSVTNVTVGFNLGGNGDPALGQFFIGDTLDPVGKKYNFVTVGIHGFKPGQTLEFTSVEDNAYPIEPIEILVESVTGATTFVGSLVTQLQNGDINDPNYLPTGNDENGNLGANTLFTASVSLDKSLHEDKFVRFSYRWKYKDGEYSGFAPFTNVCFLPGAYDFSAEQGENAASVNKTKQIILRDFAPSYMPKDVAEIEILFKEENLATVYSVRKFNVNDVEAQTFGTGNHRGRYSSDAETFSQAINPNQILRPFDQVPRSAKAQEISSNRVIYGNIKENYNLTSDENNVNADISTGLTSEKFETLEITQSNNFQAVGIDVYSQTQAAFSSANEFSSSGDGASTFNPGDAYSFDLVLGFGGVNSSNDFTTTIAPLDSDYYYAPAINPLFGDSAFVNHKPLRGAFVSDNEGFDVVTDAEPDGNFNRYDGGLGIGADDIAEGDGVYHAPTSGTYIISAAIGAKGFVFTGTAPSGESIPDASFSSPDGVWGEVLNDKYKVLPLRLAIQKQTVDPATGNLTFTDIYTPTFRPWKPTFKGFPNHDTEGVQASSPGYNDSVIRFIYHPSFPDYPSEKPATKTLADIWGPPYTETAAEAALQLAPNGDYFNVEWMQSAFNNTLSQKAIDVILAGDYYQSSLNNFNDDAFDLGLPEQVFVQMVLKQRLDFFWNAEWHDTKIGQTNPQYKLENIAINLEAGDKIRLVLQRDRQFINQYGNENCRIQLQNWSYNFKTSNENLNQLNLIPWFNPLYDPGSSFNMISAPQVKKNGDPFDDTPNDSFAAWLKKYFQDENAPLSLDPNATPGGIQTYTTWNQQMDVGLGSTLEANRFTNRWDVTQQVVATLGDQPDSFDLAKTIVKNGGPAHQLTPTPFTNQAVNDLKISLQVNGPDVVSQTVLPNNIGRSSIKSFRTYKIGVVYRDEFGRETPVLPSANNIVVNNNASDTINSFSFTCNHNAPDFADSYKFFVKETSSEYYNLAIDRIYDGGDSTAWVSFSSTDRNKVTEETILIFKKQHNSSFMAHAEFLDGGVVTNNNPNLEYPILSISNEAPPEVLSQAGVTNDFDNVSTQAGMREIQGKFFVKVRIDDAFKSNVVGDVGNNGIYNDLTTNPGVFETKPVENKDLDIYYEMSQAFPIRLTDKNVGKFIQPGAVISTAYYEPNSSVLYTPDFPQAGPLGPVQLFLGINVPDGFGLNTDPVTADTPNGLEGTTVQGVIGAFTENTGENSDFCEIKLGSLAATWGSSLGATPPPGARLILTFKNPNGTTVTSDVAVYSDQYSTSIFINPYTHPVAGSSHKSTISFPWFNCFSFANGVESNRIRDRFNQPFISNGVKASTVFEDYSEEVNKNKLTFSGIYNSKSSVNKTNQFIIGEGITKDLNPDYGQIQRLLARDTDLVTFCEDKVLRILSNKDALFNADGNTNVVASKNVLGTATPFVGEYGISYHPESLAKYGYRVYFTDIKRGKVLRLSMDGITPISDYGMSDFFFDTFSKTNKDSKIIGSYDNAQGEYNLTIPVTSGGLGNGYGYVGSNEQYVAPTFSDDIGGYTISFDESNNGWTSFRTYVKEAGFSVNDKYYTFKKGRLWQHHQSALRNNYYGQQFNCSIKFIFNDASNIVKSFKTVNYEGTQAKIYESLTNNEYYDNVAKDGWYVEKISTDIQEGQVINFRNKENKWHKYITGTSSADLDLSELSAQGFGLPSGTVLGDTTGGDGLGDDGADVGDTTGGDGIGDGDIGNDGGNDGVEAPIEIVFGCTNPAAANYNLLATQDDGSCQIIGCTNPSAVNFDPQATVDSGTCEILSIPGCTDATATNYNPNANVDDGSCQEPVPEEIPGCTDPSANNFMLAATIDNGTCIFLGCTDPAAPNFNAQANQDDGSCEPPIIFGCTNPEAVNYNPEATQDDGTCFVQPPLLSGCTDPEALNYNPNIAIDDGSCVFTVLGCTNNTADNYDPLANTEDGSCEWCGNFNVVIISQANPTSPEANDGYIQATGQSGSSLYDVQVFDANGFQQNPYQLGVGAYTVVVIDVGDIDAIQNYAQVNAFDYAADTINIGIVNPSEIEELPEIIAQCIATTEIVLEIEGFDPSVAWGSNILPPVPLQDYYSVDEAGNATLDLPNFSTLSSYLAFPENNFLSIAVYLIYNGSTPTLSGVPNWIFDSNLEPFLSIGADGILPMQIAPNTTGQARSATITATHGNDVSFSATLTITQPAE